MWENDVVFAEERMKDLQRDAAEARRARQVVAADSLWFRLYAPALDWLGHMLIETGLNLRARYGCLELSEGHRA